MAKCDRIEIFCNEILSGKSQRQAYYAAYPSSKKWKEKTVDNKASELANSKEVLGRLEEKRQELQKRTSIKQEDIIEELKTIGFAELDPSIIKPADKTKALELIAKILGLDKPPESEEIGSLETLIKGFREI